LSFCFFSLWLGKRLRKLRQKKNRSYGISVEVPRSWHIIAGETKDPVETAGVGVIDLSRMPVPGNNLLLKANATPADRPAWVSVAFLPKPFLSPDQVAKFSPTDLQDYDRELHQKVENFLQSRGMELWEWHGTRKDFLNDHMTLVSEYHRRARDTSVMWEQINTIPLNTGMVTLTVAYNVVELPWRSVVMHIRSSCQINTASSS
jgi:hypothetical protein